jgi:hypothetical protein
MQLMDLGLKRVCAVDPSGIVSISPLVYASCSSEGGAATARAGGCEVRVRVSAVVGVGWVWKLARAAVSPFDRHTLMSTHFKRVDALKGVEISSRVNHVRRDGVRCDRATGATTLPAL